MIETISKNVYNYTIPLSGGMEQYFFLGADVHFDSKDCERDLFKRHMREVRERDARALFFGDFFDCMGGKFDKRTSKEDIRPEYNIGHYFDAITDDAADFLSPFKDNIDFIAKGNHEDSIRQRHEISLIDHLCYKLDKKPVSAPYSGFIRFTVRKKMAERDGPWSSKVMYYTHGNGANAEVTGGVIQTNRRQVMVLADFYLSAHLHNEYEFPRTRVRLNDKNNVTIEKVKHWQLGTYNNTWWSSYSDKKGHAPGCMGGRWLKVRFKNNEIFYESQLAE